MSRRARTCLSEGPGAEFEVLRGARRRELARALVFLLLALYELREVQPAEVEASGLLYRGALPARPRGTGKGYTIQQPKKKKHSK